ncbi:hypothetical protein VE01_09818 [Pseudogymnoascus verrucosus]|uniref:non-specific serine/threonine protein kinase n=1 Tax=Pseudogymnoascus verrucosus TaxID=342668 RepID=A0A1B8G9X3_9PEZI|nr:uncharacterized protein VE01_09818 [Pseudogymnoascus verrucosus]OBT92628.1 hypothetical protein VE01_09818 [Pseudogymnoascus verrucosus]
MRFSNTGFKTINASEVLEEEQFADFNMGQYYPVNIGETFNSKYQVVGKLGFGVISTVWLARDLKASTCVPEGGNSSHPGYGHVRKALGIFTIPRAGGDHYCLVQKPTRESFRDLLYRNPILRFTEELLKAGLKQVFLVLDYLHTECQLVHTDIKGDNILQEFEDISILDAFTKPKWTTLLHGNLSATHRSLPQITTKAHQIWDLFEGRHMFYGNDPVGKGYSTRAHLAEVIGMLGPPPMDLLGRGIRSHEFFAEDGAWKAEVDVPQDTSLERSDEFLEGKNKEIVLVFMRGMLQWRLEDRKTAKELLEDPLLNDQID